MSSSNHIVVVEQEFNNPPSEVWKAITELREMEQWFFDNIPAFNNDQVSLELP